jgi:DNA-binding CsgD family transcriptional regulator
VASARDRARCRQRLERLSDSRLDCDSIQREAIAELQRVIGFDRWCWPFADPQTLLPLSGIADHDYGPRLGRSLELEYSGADYAAKHDLARRPRSAGSLSAETGGDLARSPRWDEVMRPVGIGDVAAVACRDQFGCWGWIEAYRDDDDRRFDDEDLALLAVVGRRLGSALRRHCMSPVDGHPAGPEAPDPPGVLVLDAELRVVGATAAARAWIDALPASALFASWGVLPPMVYPAATRARSDHGGPARALSRTAAGGWMSIEAAVLDDTDGAIAVTLRRAAPSETFGLLCRAHALTPRERELAGLVAEGLDTRAIAERLFISPNTVQDHLKAVFDKTATRSRGALLAKLNGSTRVPTTLADTDGHVVADAGGPGR